MNYSIRPVKPEDIESLTSVEAICFPEAEAATKESFIDRVAAFPECFFVAEIEERSLDSSMEWQLILK